MTMPKTPADHANRPASEFVKKCLSGIETSRTEAFASQTQSLSIADLQDAIAALADKEANHLWWDQDADDVLRTMSQRCAIYRAFLQSVLDRRIAADLAQTLEENTKALQESARQQEIFNKRSIRLARVGVGSAIVAAVLTAVAAFFTAIAAWEKFQSWL